MLAEIGDCRERYPSYRALAADAGQAPVAVKSGKAKARAVSLGLQPPAHPQRLLGRSPTQAAATTPRPPDIHKHARDRGASHTHATRVLGRAGSQVTWRLWHDHDTYGPLRHTALQRVIADGG